MENELSNPEAADPGRGVGYPEEEIDVGSPPRGRIGVLPGL